MNKQKVFIRVDDVVDLNKDTTLLLKIAREYKLKLSIGIIPNKLSEVSAIKLKKHVSDGLITIHQHGTNHIRENNLGEYGFDDEKKLINLGRRRMYELFGFYPKTISMPWQYHGKNTLHVINSINGYQIISAHFDLRPLSTLFYFFGKLFSCHVLLGHHVSYNNMVVPDTNLTEMSTSIDMMSKYNPVEWKRSSAFIAEIVKIHQNIFGVLVHPVDVERNLIEIKSMFKFLSKKYEIICLP